MEAEVVREGTDRPPQGAPETPPLVAVPGSVFVVADSTSAVGAFRTEAEAEGVRRSYPSVPMVVYRFALDVGHPADKIFILPYRDINAVAFATNNKPRCEEVQRALLSVALTYPDEVDWWECCVGAILPAARRRLDEMKQAERACASDALAAQAELEDEEKTRKLFGALGDSPLERLARETEKMSFLEFVVPKAVEAHAVETPAGEGEK